MMGWSSFHTAVDHVRRLQALAMSAAHGDGRVRSPATAGSVFHADLHVPICDRESADRPSLA